MKSIYTASTSRVGTWGGGLVNPKGENSMVLTPILLAWSHLC